MARMIPSLLPEINRLQAALESALRDWHNPEEPPAGLFATLHLAQAKRPRVFFAEPVPPEREVQNILLTYLLAETAVTEPESVALLQAHFIEQQSVEQIAEEQGVATAVIQEKLGQGLQKVSQTLLEQESQIRQKHQAYAQHFFPKPTYSQYIGRYELRQQIKQQLLNLADPWLIGLVGHGGIGKTALARAVIEELLPYCYFERIVWLTAEHQDIMGQPIPAELLFSSFLRPLCRQLDLELSPQADTDAIFGMIIQYLKTRPCLVVIDNLEYTADSDYIHNRLSQLTNPSKVLLLRRAQPRPTPNLTPHFLTELPLETAVELLAHQLVHIGQPSRLTPSEMSDIYYLLGGNPLALKLVANITGYIPLPTITAELTPYKTEPIGMLYRQLHTLAWQTLEETEQQLLQVMPLISESGAAMPQLRAVSALPDEELEVAIQKLLLRPLLEERGTLRDRRYGIHLLTRAFLHSEIIDWPIHR